MPKTINSLEGIDKGWSIQVYSPDRRLLCSIYPSHAWTFFAGLTLGFILTLISLSGQIPSQSSTSSVSPSITVPFNLD